MIDIDFRWGVEAQQGQKREDWLHGWTVETYVEVLWELFTAATTKNLDSIMIDKGEDTKLRQFARQMWPRMKEARLFEIDPDDAVDVLADIRATINHDVHPEVILELLPAYFENLPFEYCFLGFGPGLKMSDVWLERNMSVIGNDPGLWVNSPVPYIAGFMVNAKNIWKFNVLVEQPTPGVFKVIASNWAQLLYDGAIYGALPMFEYHQMLLVEELIHSIKEAQQVVLKSPTVKHKMRWKRAMKNVNLPKYIKKMPRPYYVVKIAPKVIREKTAGAQQSRIVEWSHRWDCEGHYRHRVQRGPLPLSPDLSAKFENETKGGNKWAVSTTEDPPEWIQKLLEERGMPRKGPNEWLAVLRWWIDPHIRGPEDKPYVPASRKLDFKLKRRSA